jgi:hypothetical protein
MNGNTMQTMHGIDRIGLGRPVNRQIVPYRVEAAWRAGS